MLKEMYLVDIKAKEQSFMLRACFMLKDMYEDKNKHRN